MPACFGPKLAVLDVPMETRVEFLLVGTTEDEHLAGIRNMSLLWAVVLVSLLAKVMNR
jgi:hypothetical protein